VEEAYQAELERMNQSIRVQWFETEELIGPDPPHLGKIKLYAK
jgi:hypothetical protein